MGQGDVEPPGRDRSEESEGRCACRRVSPLPGLRPRRSSGEAGGAQVREPAPPQAKEEGWSAARGP